MSDWSIFRNRWVVAENVVGIHVMVHAWQGTSECTQIPDPKVHDIAFLKARFWKDFHVDCSLYLILSGTTWKLFFFFKRTYRLTIVYLHSILSCNQMLNMFLTSSVHSEHVPSE